MCPKLTDIHYTICGIKKISTLRIINVIQNSFVWYGGNIKIFYHFFGKNMKSDMHKMSCVQGVNIILHECIYKSLLLADFI